jgi:hypothetical protein
MTPSLEAALAECDELNVSLWVQDGKLSFRAGEVGFPDSLRDQLRAHRDELAALLESDARPEPEWVPFLSRKLDLRWFEFPLVKTVSVLLVNGQPYYRVTAATWVKFCRAVDDKAATILSNPVALGEVQAAAALLVSLGKWVAIHYRPDQIRRAFAKPQPLPIVPRGPFDTTGTDLPCRPSPAPSRCAPSSTLPTVARRRTKGATTATGSDLPGLF